MSHGASLFEGEGEDERESQTLSHPLSQRNRQQRPFHCLLIWNRAFFDRASSVKKKGITA